MKSLMIVVAILLGSVVAGASPEIDKPAPSFSGVTSSGESVSLQDFAGKPVILEWTNHLCPYVRKHYESGNMQRIQRELTEAGAVWISIISSAPGKQGHVDASEANTLTTARGVYADMVILDPSGEIGRLYDAKTTPQMFLIDEEQTIRYMGAIDDKPSSRMSSLTGAHNYLVAAWQSFKAGQAITSMVTKPYGCTVKYGSVSGYK
jgi:peroxiredoxin